MEVLKGEAAKAAADASKWSARDLAQEAVPAALRAALAAFVPPPRRRRADAPQPTAARKVDGLISKLTGLIEDAMTDIYAERCREERRQRGMRASKKKARKRAAGAAAGAAATQRRGEATPGPPETSRGKQRTARQGAAGAAAAHSVRGAPAPPGTRQSAVPDEAGPAGGQGKTKDEGKERKTERGRWQCCERCLGWHPARPCTTEELRRRRIWDALREAREKGKLPGPVGAFLRAP
jgi:hypothetical protein